jgi:hypothetical protein
MIARIVYNDKTPYSLHCVVSPVPPLSNATLLQSMKTLNRFVPVQLLANDMPAPVG